MSCAAGSGAWTPPARSGPAPSTPAAFAQLRRHWADTGRRPPAVIDDPRRLLRRVIDAPDAPDAPPETVSDLLAEIQWAQARLLRPEAYAAGARAAGRRPAQPVDAVAETYARYVEAKRTHGVLDLNDLLTRCADLLERDAAAAAAARWRIRHLFVDEFQDVNPAQWRLLGRVARGTARPLRGGRSPPGRLRLERRRPDSARPPARAPPGDDRSPPRRQPPVDPPGNRRCRCRPRRC